MHIYIYICYFTARKELSELWTIYILLEVQVAQIYAFVKGHQT